MADALAEAIRPAPDQWYSFKPIWPASEAEAADLATTAPRGIPYCPVDGLQYPPGARFCIQDEAELLLACANCGTTIRAAAESCFRCGTRATTASVSEAH